MHSIFRLHGTEDMDIHGHTLIEQDRAALNSAPAPVRELGQVSKERVAMKWLSDSLGKKDLRLRGFTRLRVMQEILE